ncbi:MULTISPECIES: AlpA family phage regulatory protein [Stutzerimonas stutzeri group]|nr:AlpA family phage regulatory protein [Stutzerimonas degradans]
MAYRICATNQKENAIMSSKRLEPLVMLRLRDVLNRTGLSRSTIYNKLDASSPHYDEKFPRQVRVGSGAVRWIESEIDLWIEKCIVSSRENGAQ